MQNLVGQQLGNYRLTKLLGRGGFAHVYLGEHVHLGRQAAIKVLSTVVTSDEAEKFLSEARNIASLDHPHITRVHEFSITDDGTPFLVMEYAPNGSLAELRPSGVVLPMITVLSYIKQVASALQYAHDYKKLIHRDVKPANMLLRRNNEVVLSDFGIAVIAQSSQSRDKQQDAVGTIHYMAPEQIEGNPCLASDQYALGIVAYEWLSGHLPFNGSPIEIGSQHMLKQPPSLGGKVSASVEQVVMHALEKDPKQRFPSVQHFADALESAYQEAQKVTFSLPSLHSSPGPHTEGQVLPETAREVLSITVTPFEESWTTARALASHYQQVIDSYYQSASTYEQTKDQLQQDFTIEQKNIRERWTKDSTDADAINAQVDNALRAVQRQIGKSRWHKVVNEVVPLPASQHQWTDTKEQLARNCSTAINASEQVNALLKQHNIPLQISGGSFITIGTVLLIAVGTVYAAFKIPGLIISLFIIGALFVLRQMIRHTYTNNTIKQLKQQYTILLQARDMVKLTYQRHYAFLRDQYLTASDRSKKQYDHSIAQVEHDFEEKIAQLQNILAICADKANLLAADWNDPQWQQWQPFRVPTSIVRVGTWKVTGPRELPPIPALANSPGIENILIETDGAGRHAALAAIQSIMLRLLATHPPGGIRLILIDPIGLGQNVASFMQLADEDERLISSRAWTEPKHIEKELADLSEHMENVIQKYLRNQYKTIDEYNAVAGEIAEPYRILVVVGFPVNFSTETARRLVSIATNGPRCGVSTLVLMDTEQAQPPKFTLAELERSASTIIWNEQSFVWKHKDVGNSQLMLDTIPYSELFHTLLSKIGKESQKMHQKVEIPFRRMIEHFIPETRWWANDQSTKEEINIPLGPSGATRYQHVWLGQGTAHHVLVVGKTGSGKTNLLHVLIIALCLRYHPDELELYLIDFKTVGFTPYAMYKLPHARVIAVQSEREFGLSVLQGLEEELEHRKKLFSRMSVQNIIQYRNSQPKQRMPRILLLVDEFQEFFSREDEIAREAATLLDRLVRTGRAFGIHVVLGSQTVAGTFTIARSTISQMAVRIALQCEEADSRLVLSDDNPAARLLSRPGEAIYNADNGAVGDNNTFQCVWLPDEEIQVYLNAIQQLAYQQKYTPPWSQIIFEGDKKADVDENQSLWQALKAHTWSTSSQSHTIWLGEPIKIKEPTSVHLHHRSGNNVLIAGPNGEVAVGLLTIALISLATQLAPADATFYVLDFTSADSLQLGMLEQPEGIPHTVKVMKNRRDLSSIISQICEELEGRTETNALSRPDVYLLIYGLHRAHELHIEDDIYKDATATSLFKSFSYILQAGPELGIHTLAWCDMSSNIHRVLDHRILLEFEIRIAFQMTSEDSRRLIDSTEANMLGSHRALLVNQESGLREKFIPYTTPSLEWLQRAVECIRHKR